MILMLSTNLKEFLMRFYFCRKLLINLIKNGLQKMKIIILNKDMKFNWQWIK